MRKLPALLVPVALVFPGVGILSSRSAQKGHGRSSGDAVVTVRGPAGRQIPASFLGLSFEFSAIARYAGTHPGALDPVFLQLIRNLSPGQAPALRIGGKTTDSAWWPIPGQRSPAGTSIVLTPRSLAVTGALASLLNARLIIGVDLKPNNLAEASAKSQAFERAFGSHIEALELGNQPELYPRFRSNRKSNGREPRGRHPTQEVEPFMRDYSRLARALPGPLAGPDTTVPAWTAQLGRFLSREPRVAVATLQDYPLQCGAAKASRRYPSVAGLARVAHAHQVPLRIDEMNTVSCGGNAGVSGTFASALWALDTLFGMARAGVDGVNIDSHPGAQEALFSFQRVRGRWAASVGPEYYGLMMFAQAAPPGSRLLVTSAKNAAGIQAWATRGTDGHIRIVLINRGSRARVVRVNAPVGYATLERLQAPSLSATRRVRLGGQSFGRKTFTGELRGRSTSTRIRRAGASYMVSLSGGSAALVNVVPSAPGQGGGSGPGGPGSTGSGVGGSGSGGGSGPGPGGNAQTGCMSKLQPGGVYPDWSSVAACGYPTPTSIDPNGLASGGTAGVPDGTTLLNASTCGCLPSGASWSAGGYVFVRSNTTLTNLYIPGGVVLAGPGVSVTVQNSDIESPTNGTGYTIDGDGGGPITLSHDWIHNTYNGTSCSQNSSATHQNIGIGNFTSVTLTDDDVDCFGLVVSDSTTGATIIDGTVLISEGLPCHCEDIYAWSGGGTLLVRNSTLVNPTPQTTNLFGDDASGKLSNITVTGNIVAGNQNNGGINVGCTAGNGFQADFGNYPNTNILVENNRFSNVYNVNAPGGGFVAGNTDGGPGTTWAGNFMDNNLAAVRQPAHAC
jgi:hypothetical protein